MSPFFNYGKQIEYREALAGTIIDVEKRVSGHLFDPIFYKELLFNHLI